MQSALLLHKLDNVVHEDEYLAPEAFGNVTVGVYGGIASGPTNGRNYTMCKNAGVAIPPKTE